MHSKWHQVVVLGDSIDTCDSIDGL